MTQISLGTAQFGLKYGVTNKNDKIDISQIKSILDTSYLSNIKFLDTAIEYGDSEINIGRLKSKKHKFNITSKIYIKKEQLIERDIHKTWDNMLKTSLLNLKINQFDSYFLHNPDILVQKNGKVVLNWLSSILERKLTKRVGLSIYSSDILHQIPLNNFQIVQLPLSIYDQRLIEDGTIELLKNRKIAIHARSIFLQGLILTSVNDWPSFFSKEFSEHHIKFSSRVNKIGSSLLESVFRFIERQKDIEAFIIGISSLKELKELLSIWKKVYSNNGSYPISFEEWSWHKKMDLDPRLWHKN
ncbi:hypothetical protein CL656_04980 [bacterium]|nr:hypothetical protein [bacterium]